MADYSYSENKEDAERLFDMFDAIKKNKLPVIGRVNGAALGGGSGLVSACDFSLTIDKANIFYIIRKLQNEKLFICHFNDGIFFNENGSQNRLLSL
mgnify:CR=1 FL=1